MKLISVIIVTFNSNDIIEKCINNLFLHNDIDDSIEVIIVDNSTSEISAKMFGLLEEQFPQQLKLIKNDHNGGYGQGNNLGIAHASAPILAIMNPDIILTEPLFKTVLFHFDKQNNLGMLAFKQCGGSNLSFYFRPEYYFPFLTSLVTKFCNYFNFFSKKTMFLSGAFLFINKKEFQEIECFDQNLFLYLEESDITKRFLKINIDVIYNKSKSYIHEIDGRSEMSNYSYKIFVNSLIYYLNKFSFKSNFFIKALYFELKFKTLIYLVIGKKELSLAIREQIEVLKIHIK